MSPSRSGEASSPAEGFDVLDFFDAMARDVGARSAWPLEDGSVLFVFEGAVVLPDGGKLLDLGEGRSAVLKWSPEPSGGCREAPPLEGSVAVQGLNRGQLEALAARIALACRDRGIGPLRPLAFRPEGSGRVEISEGLLRGSLGLFFHEQRTYFGGLRLGRLQKVSGGVRVPFSGGGRRVVLEIRGAPPAGSSTAEWHLVSPLCLAVTSDTHAGRISSPREDVRAYLAYALRRAFDPQAEVLEPGLGLPVLDGFGAPPRKGEEAPFFDGRDESPVDDFFIAPMDRSIGAFEAATSLTEADAGVAFVTYAHPTCLGKLPLIDLVEHGRWMWHRFSPIPFSMPDKPLFSPELPEMDLMTGADGRFRAKVRQALEREETEIVALLGTCIPELIGLDVTAIVEEESRSRSRSRPVVVSSFRAAIDDGTAVSSLWEQLFGISQPAGSRRRGLINLVGFAPEASRIARELRGDLCEFGIEVNGFLIPSFRSRAVKRFFEAQRTFVSRTVLTELEFRDLRRKYPEMEAFDIEPPFGPSGTRRFLEILARECGNGSNPAEGIEALWAPHAERWESFRSRAEKHEVGVLVGGADADYLLEPARLFGIGLVSILREMGFGLTIGFRSTFGESESKQLADDLKCSLEERHGADGRLTVEPVPAFVDGPGWLRARGVSLIFTEYPPDERIVRVGCHSFHPRDFEMGFAGAVRSISRLVRYAESSFFDTFFVAGKQ